MTISARPVLSSLSSADRMVAVVVGVGVDHDDF